MAKKMSNRERIQRAALEAKAQADEKSTRKTSATTKTTKKKTSSGKSGRVKLVWKVFNPAFKEVATFPYPQKDNAEKKAAELSKKSGKDYRVRGVKVPMETDE